MAAIVVLLDMEWVETENGNSEITQMAALRVDEAWKPLDSFEAVIKPACLSAIDPIHIALNGYPREKFEKGETEADAVRRLSDWLRESDSIFVWHFTTRRTLSAAWRTVFQAKPPCSVTCVNQEVCRVVNPESVNPGNLYAIAAKAGEAISVPHRAVDDADLLRRLSERIGLPQKKPNEERKPSEKPKNLPERNRNIIARTQYNYIFLPDSPVFHTTNCPCILHARKIEGSISFKTAAKGRRPCKICNPVPEIQIEPPPIPTVPAKHAQEPKTSQREIVKVRLLGGSLVEMRRGKIIGFCHNLSHPGKLTKAILDEHQCLSKQCPFLERYEDAPFWVQRKRKELARYKARQNKKEKKAILHAEAESMSALRADFQRYADSTNSNIEIIRVEHPNSYSYTVFYVSDNRFFDADRFHSFIDAVITGYHWSHINMRHIRDIDGHFVTREEYHARKR